ncbi:hypothetical protein ECC02_002478 [Trypanosoma cruzi]|uniref:Puromycin-sensitive aminopeptidase-like protein n=1 Tax=Trypanosoma cruzi TaxID=5693 RepID=A0A7J6YD43_TRYCR|nr:hypothetical protein ECC02_002478 [Trypanosoma cruzi]
MKEQRHHQRGKKAAGDGGGDGEASFRLPRNFVPRRYDLFFAPRPAKGIFFGAAIVTVEVEAPLASPTRCLTMHALELSIEPSHVSVMPSPGRRGRRDLSGEVEKRAEEAEQLRCVAVHSSCVDETITLEFSSCLPNDVGDVFVVGFSHFTGFIHDSSASCGLFYSNSYDTNFLSTHLEPTNARLLFPCFDEPSYRAVFQLTVEFDSRYTIVSGTRAVREELVEVDEEMFAASFRDPPLFCSWDALRFLARDTSNNINRDSTGVGHVVVRVDDGVIAHEYANVSTNDINFGPAPHAPEVKGCVVVEGEEEEEEEEEENVLKAAGQQEGRCNPPKNSRKNDPLVSSSNDSPTCFIRRVTFDETPKLSTCIVGFNTGKFYIIERETTKSKLLCRVIFPAEVQTNHGWYALDLLTKAVAFFDEYFDFLLPLQKLDLVCLRCFSFLGMGNWGMVNMHLDYMLVNESTPLERRQRIARLIGHKVAHQWVGDWATVSWWNFLWMTEGICRCLEFMFVDSVFPDWLIWDEFLTQVLDDALVLDTQPEKTHPVQYCIANPRLIEDCFDSISFGKGASIMRMLFSLLGGDCLRAATRRLLQRCSNTCFDSQMFLDCLVHGEHEAERREMAAAVVRGAEESGHPLLYVEQKPDGVCCVTQYQMPDLRQGILQAYVKLQQGKETTNAMDLMAPRRMRVFNWNAEHVLQRSNYNIHAKIVELEEMGCFFGRTFCMRSSQEIIKCFPDRLIYLNYRGTGVLRCDYDTATWRRIFEVAPFLSSQDCIVITMTLFRFRNIHIGQDATDRMDRCELLLEWLMFITQSSVMTASQWSYITHQIEYIFYMVRDYPCWELFSKFVCSLYTPLIRRGSLSFAAQEQAVTFESRRDISRTTVLHILQVLAICNCPVILDESREQVERALVSIMPQFANDFARGTFTTHNSVAFNVFNDSDAVAVSIAMQCLIEHGDMKTWWTLACVVAAIFNISLQKTAEELHLDVVEGIYVAHLDEMHKSRWLNMIAPALFAFDTSSTLPFLLLVLHNFKSLNTPIAKAILRNKRLVTSLFECTSLTQSMPHITVIRHLLIMHGAMLCSDSNLILLMMASVAGEAATERSGGGSKGRGKQEPMRAGGMVRSLPVANAILAMKTNCLWMDYCCDHYDSFLSKRFREKQLTTTPLGTPRASVMDMDTMEEDGVST